MYVFQKYSFPLKILIPPKSVDPRTIVHPIINPKQYIPSIFYLTAWRKKRPCQHFATKMKHIYLSSYFVTLSNCKLIESNFIFSYKFAIYSNRHTKINTNQHT
ncbi:hypothetical protein AAHE18_18G169600 [Arachis hypogaea]